MLKSKRFWGFLIAAGSVVAAQFGVGADAATVETINTAVAVVTPVYMLITKLIDKK
jgi:hypothetical protein